MAAMFDRLAEDIMRSGFEVHAAEILSDGLTVFHHAFGEDRRYPVYSVTKCVTSAAFSTACDEGKVAPDTPLADFLERRYRAEMPEGFADMPFSRFLSMTAGEYPFRPEGDDWVSFALSSVKNIRAGAFCYSNIPAYLVGAALENAVGEGLAGYIQKRLFDPLEIPQPPYRTCPHGHFYGATGMELTVHELAKLGELYLRRGKWNGRQLISENAVSDALSVHSQTGAPGVGCGYIFRIYADHFDMSGKWGQRCVVYPEKKLVLAWLANEPGRSEELINFFCRAAKEQNVF